MYQVTTLKNGLKVISKELKAAKTILLQVSVKAGSKFVPIGKEGLAHLSEHMIMNGSDKYPKPLLVRRTIEELGGTINGRTGVETAIYFVKVATRDLEKVADVLFSLITTPLLDGKELVDEKKIVLEEIAKYEDSVGNSVSDNFYSLVFKGHSLGKRILGYRETVEDISMGNVSEFFSGYYLPQNIVVCAAGGIKHAKLTDLIQGYFATAANKEVPEYKRFQSDPEGPKVRILKKTSNQARIVLGFLTYPRNIKDHILGKFVCRLLNSTDRLFGRLREQEQLAYSVSATYDVYQDAALHLIRGGFSYNRVGEAVKVLTEELQVLKGKPIEENELAKIRKLIEVDLLFAFETPGGWVNFALSGNDLLGHAIEPEEYLREVSKVTAGAIKSFAQEIFVPEGAYLSTVHENINTEDLEKLIREGLRT